LDRPERPSIGLRYEKHDGVPASSHQSTLGDAIDAELTSLSVAPHVVSGYDGMRLVTRSIALPVGRSQSETPILLSFWLVESSAGNGERRVAVQIIAVRPDGTRILAAERQADHYFSAPPASPAFSPGQRSDLFQRAVEPTLQRELKHRGAANGDGSYSATLIGYVELQ
jgi:hypothetical protein